ncbi:SIS domain-containing protein [Saccharopolyspora sp. NPDC000359]|uniref:SIS domain-containing protein n=1 Tax=Saccharopolyspora sp. NPDC000359 TaxID=3154251 RepID=UPI00332FC083
MNRTGVSDLRDSWEEYVQASAGCLPRMSGQIEQLVLELDDLRHRGATLYLAGNGGSASAASHLAQDLLKGTAAPGNPPIRALSLTDNLSMLTAYANDLGYDRVFVEPLKVMAKFGDRLLVISCSGSSPNVVAAVRYARDVGLGVIAVTAGDGGSLRAMADIEVNVPTKDVGLAEAVHAVVFHFVTQALHDRPGLR